MLRKHFTIYHTAGDGIRRALVPEEIDIDWQTKRLEAIDEAKETAADMNAENPSFRPFGFHFQTRARQEGDLDSHVEAESYMYFLGGHIEPVETMEERNDPTERQTVMNMKNLGADFVISNHNSWTWVQPFQAGDTLLPIPDWARNSSRRLH